MIYPNAGYDQINFEFNNDTDVFRACSLQWHNHHYVFGGIDGRALNAQVSMVNGNRLEKIKKLEFAFDEGACTVLNQATILLCFNRRENQSKLCRKSNNPLGSFTKLPASTYGHAKIRVASFDGNYEIFQNNK